MVITPDGRKLCVEVRGDENGRAIFALAGTPNSRLQYGGWVRDAEQRGIRLITYDRPGYGASTPDPGHTVADGAADVRTIADALEVERFGVWGLSGGGPYALACAALLGDRVVAAASIGGIAPRDAPGLDYFAGMGRDNVEDISLAQSNPAAARRKVTADRAQLLALTADGLREAWASLISDADAAVLAGPFGEYLVHGLREGLAAGEEGWWDDGIAHISPWGFALSSIAVPVKVWQGRQDHFVPCGHGEWLARQIPGAESVLSETDGHLTVVAGRIGDVHGWLVDRF